LTNEKRERDEGASEVAIEHHLLASDEVDPTFDDLDGDRKLGGTSWCGWFLGHGGSVPRSRRRVKRGRITTSPGTTGGAV